MIILQSHNSEKPHLSARIDPRHPLSFRLIYCALLNEGAAFAVVDYANRNTGVLDQDNIWAANYLDFDSGTGITLDSAITFADDVPYTVSWKAEQFAGAGVEGIVLGDETTQNYIWMREGTYLRLQCNGNSWDFTGTQVFTGLHRYTLTVTPPEVVELYIDGVRAAGPTGSGNTSFVGSNIGDGYNGAGTFAFNGHMYDMMIWDRAFSYGEASRHAQDPYQMFQQEFLFVEEAAAPGTILPQITAAYMRYSA